MHHKDFVVYVTRHQQSIMWNSSNKSKKFAVLEQLKEAAQVATKSSPENYSNEAQRLFDLRNELNEYVEALHKRYPFGYSLFELFEKYSQLPKGEDKPCKTSRGYTFFPLVSFVLNGFSW